MLNIPLVLKMQYNSKINYESLNMHKFWFRINFLEVIKKNSKLITIIINLLRPFVIVSNIYLFKKGKS